MGGGGNDAFPLAKAFLEAFPAIFSELGMQAVVLTGPNMPSQQRDLLRQACRTSAVRIENGIEDAGHWIRDASAILTMAGYNSLCEILKWRKRALVVPRGGPSAEQQIRSRLFAERSLVRALGPGTPAPEQLAEALVRLLLEDGVPNEVAIPPLNGAARSAAFLLRPNALPAEQALRLTTPRRMRRGLRLASPRLAVTPPVGLPAVSADDGASVA
jgi:predicted glycosyltransferase